MGRVLRVSAGFGWAEDISNMPDRYFEAALRAATRLGIKDVEVHYRGGSESLTRFANNAIHQNVAESSETLSVRLLLGRKSARAGTNRLDAEGIARCVEEAAALTRSMADDDEFLPLAEPQPVTPVDRYDAATASCSPQVRAKGVAAAIREAGVAFQAGTAAGIYSTEDLTEAVFNSNGVRALHRETMAKFSITVMGQNSSGWAKASSVRCADLDPAALASTAARKARLSADPREVPPGPYTVVLEPAAVLDFIGQIMPGFSATAIADQRSFLTERLGGKLFDGSIQISDDVFHPLQSGAPFDGEGQPRQVLALARNGIPQAIAYSRAAARKASAQATGHGHELPNDTGEAPENIVIHGGSASVEEMIASTARGILVSRLWYIREVDPYETIMTGMTRDGTFLIEDGAVTAGLRNFRFNQSVIEALRNVVMLGPAVRTSGEEMFDMVVPAMKIGGFGFTEVTRF
jgi:PmbA protein